MFAGMRGVVAAAFVMLALPASASADVWKGKTRQGRGVVVHTGTDGVVDGARIGWRAQCGHGTYKSRTVFTPPLDTATTTTFMDAGTYTGHPRGYRARIWVRIAGTLADDAWTGTFKVRVRVLKDGETVDTCRLRRVTWTADPA
jgi:hypothetical protein